MESSYEIGSMEWSSWTVWYVGNEAEEKQASRSIVQWHGDEMKWWKAIGDDIQSIMIVWRWDWLIWCGAIDRRHNGGLGVDMGSVAGVEEMKWDVVVMYGIGEDDVEKKHEWDRRTFVFLSHLPSIYITFWKLCERSNHISRNTIDKVASMYQNFVSDASNQEAKIEILNVGMLSVELTLLFLDAVWIRKYIEYETNVL